MYIFLKRVEKGSVSVDRNREIETVVPDSLKDISEITIDTNLPVEERIKSFMEQIENPYFFRCGKLIVQAEYNLEGKTLNDCLKEYLENQE